MIALMIEVGHEGFDAGLEIVGAEVILQQDRVLPAFDLALLLGTVRRAIVGQQSRAMDDVDA